MIQKIPYFVMALFLVAVIFGGTSDAKGIIGAEDGPWSPPIFWDERPTNMHVHHEVVDEPAECRHAVTITSCDKNTIKEWCRTEDGEFHLILDGFMTHDEKRRECRTKTT